MNAVAVMEPQRRPFMGNVVMHDAAKVGDAIYGAQPERINASVFNGSRWSLTRFPLEGAFQIGGVDTVSGKGEWLELRRPITDTRTPSHCAVARRCMWQSKRATRCHG